MEKKKEYSLLKDPLWKPSATELPRIVEPKGLTAARQWYLYEKIRLYCSKQSQDITCPLPSMYRPGTPTPVGSPNPPSIIENEPHPDSPQPPATKNRESVVLVASQAIINALVQISYYKN